MHTLIDPFEPGCVALRPPKTDVASSLFEIDVHLEEDAAVDDQPLPNPDSSSRLRCWCSED